MQRLVELSGSFRRHVNDAQLFDRYFHAYLVDWNRLTVGMDLVDDTAAALLDYEEHGFGSSQGEKYLRIYGYLQAVFVQQDALSVLASIVGCEPVTDGESAWSKLRDVRNTAVGHPLDKNAPTATGKLHVFLSRPSITRSGFTLIVCPDKAKDYVREVDLASLYPRYKDEAIALARSMVSGVRSRWPST